MPNSRLRANYETHLAAAHRHLYHASAQADQLQDYGAAEDLWEIMHHVQVLTEASLKGKKQPRRQLSILDSDRA